jgi:hypothetical protein
MKIIPLKRQNDTKAYSGGSALIILPVVAREHYKKSLIINRA